MSIIHSTCWLCSLGGVGVLADLRMLAARWISWGMASLPEGKSRGLCLAQLCAKYGLVSAMLSPYH